MIKKTILSLIIFTLTMQYAFGASEVTAKFKPVREGILTSKKPSLILKSANNYSQFGFESKYNTLKVGVLPIKDSRIIKFYRHKDKFFKQNILCGLQEFFYKELKASGLFKKVEKLDVNPPSKITDEFLYDIAIQNNVDVVLLIDLNAFNFIRGMTKADMQNMSKNHVSMYTTAAMENVINFDATMQLIYLKGGYVLWADNVTESNIEFAPVGMLPKRDFRNLIAKTQHQAALQMIKKMYYNGTEVSK